MKNFVVILFCIFLASIAAGCSTQSDTYFPRREGMTRIYQKVESGMFGMQNASKLVQTILKDRELNGKKVYPIKYEEGGKTAFIFTSEDNEGIFVFANQPFNAVEPNILNPPMYYVKYPIKVGTEWKVESKTYHLQKIVPITMQYRIESVEETVTISAGTFNKCLKMIGKGQTTVDMGMMGKAQIDKEEYNWYAPNVGWIKGVVKEESKHLLVGSYTGTYQLEEWKNK